MYYPVHGVCKSHIMLLLVVMLHSVCVWNINVRITGRNPHIKIKHYTLHSYTPLRIYSIPNVHVPVFFVCFIISNQQLYRKGTRHVARLN
jgi:ABC-type uncharacterized transport system permease subunit